MALLSKVVVLVERWTFFDAELGTLPKKVQLKIKTQQ